jgi:hypothetical protein
MRFKFEALEQSVEKEEEERRAEGGLYTPSMQPP